MIPSDWFRRQARPKLVGVAAVIALVSGVLLGWYSANLSQAVILQVSFLGDPAPSESWSCAVHLNNEDSFRTVTGTGNGGATFYYVNNILATCRKLDTSIYSIGVSFKTVTGQILTGTSAGPSITTNTWVRGASPQA